VVHVIGTDADTQEVREILEQVGAGTAASMAERCRDACET
jgi:hypothetical protein